MKRPHVTRIPTRVALAACLLAGLSWAYVLPAVRASASGTFKVVVTPAQPLSLADLQVAAKRARERTRELNDALRETMARYSAAQARQRQLGIALAEVRTEVAVAQSKLDYQRAVASSRLASIYKAGDYGVIEALTQSGGLSGWDDSVVYFRLITEHDREASSGLAMLASQVEQGERAITAQRQESIAVGDEIAQQRAVLAGQIAQRRAILDELVAQIEKIVAQQAALDPSIGVHSKYTPITWAQALLQQLGMPLTNANVSALAAWELAEGGHWNNSAHYNPLNTTQPEPGATSMNPVGVKAYTSWAQGFQATITTLHNGRYEAILAALRGGDSAAAVSQAVANSPWGTGSFERLL